jgi:hypothetical protein
MGVDNTAIQYRDVKFSTVPHAWKNQRYDLEIIPEKKGGNIQSFFFLYYESPELDM